jgi:predicted permease
VFGGYGGRRLTDDVVDIGLGAIFGSLLGNTNNVSPGLTTDNVGSNDVAFGATFPYLAAAH